MYTSVDLFAGIGGIRKGFENAFKDEISTVFVSEWDKYAQKTYQLNFHDCYEIAGDITQINEKEIPSFDICLAGFPCQAFSLAGKRKGFEDDYKGMCRGTLFQEVVRICEFHNPKVIFCENVKGLINQDRGRLFRIIKESFQQLGYTVYWKLLNSKDFGVPQNRERVYIVAFRNDIDSTTFQFPEGNNSDTCIRDILEEKEVSVKYYLSTTYLDTLKRHKERHAAKGHGFGYEIRDLDGKAASSSMIMSIDREKLDANANVLFKEISIHNGSFELEEMNQFANEIKVQKMKAPSADTTDIKMQIQDIHTNYIRDVGFSIKSEVGNAPSLLNAGQTTNFIYKINGLTIQQAKNINSITTKTKIKDRMKAIKEYGGTIEYIDMYHSGFKRNLIMVDSSMPQIIGNMLLYYYDEDIKTCSQLVQLVGERDPLKYGDAMMYEYKFKKFLCSCALGMKPAKVWDGLDEANGGYIIVKSNGEILAYHIYNRNFFEKYLLDNTVLERGSTSRHDYMSIYEENGELYMKLNLQVRFK